MYSINIFFGKTLVLIKRYREIKTMIYNHLKEQLGHEPSKQQVEWCLGDYYFFKRKYKGTLKNDYFEAKIYRKSDFVRNESINNAAGYKWRNSLYDPLNQNIFFDKELFYSNFSEYLNRKCLLVDEKISFNDFAEFVKTCDYKVFVKVPESCGGKGVNFYDLSDDENLLNDLYSRCRKEKLIIEEKVVQCDEISSFSLKSVNTFRIVTIVDKNGKPHIAGAVLRIGKGNSALDNFSSGGMAAQIDIKTGIVYTPASCEDGSEYIIHPDTNKQIIGYKIEDWGKYKDFALELALKFPTMRFVGWDIIKDNNGDYCVIEGNANAGFTIMEGPLMYGLMPHYKALLLGEDSTGNL